MVRLGLLLLGSDFIRRRWLLLAAGGAVWALLGIAIFIDALDGVTYFPVHVFGYLLLIEAVVTLVVSSPLPGTPSVLRKARGAVFLVLGLLIIDAHHAASVILAISFGVAFFLDGCFRIAAAAVVRFTGWRMSLLTGALEIVFAVFMFEPYPTFYAGTVPYCIGMGIFLSGCGLLRQALRLKHLPDHAALSLLLTRGRPSGNGELPPPSSAGALVGDIIVHVWTPAGSASDVVPHPLVDRYIAAVDAKGVISTGHASLECTPDIYVSHYPAVEIDRAAGDFTRILRATTDNDVPGKFQPDYAIEAAGWCESTAEVRFERYDLARLQMFWRQYRQDTTYNLTSRNCSSAVVHCLEAALEGSLNDGHAGWVDFLRIMVNPELWVAAQLRKRAEAMAWTPGLALDYARAIKAAIHPTPWGWYSMIAVVMRFCSYVSMIYRGKPVHGIDALQGEVHTKAANKARNR
jgi:uncharacterized membrane protein HdeD (DUF308 family)